MLTIARGGSVKPGCPRSLYVVPERRAPRAPHVPAGRALHLVDLENLMRGPHQSRGVLGFASSLYRAAAPVCSGDHVVVAVNPALALEAGLEWPGARLLSAPGPDGADRALLRQVENADWVASRFDRVVIGSGDGIFVRAVEALRVRGVAVGVVAPEHGASARLMSAPNFLRIVPDVLEMRGVA